MIFISQSGITDSSRAAEWDRWYLTHLRIMATVPGVYTAQRFTTDTPGSPPSLALYGVESAAVFEGTYYQSVRGMGEWLPLVDRRYYHRNLFDGLDRAPEIGSGQVLLVADRAEPEGSLAGLDFTWLRSVAIDRTTPYRGIAVVAANALPALDDSIAVYRPGSPRFLNQSS